MVFLVCGRQPGDCKTTREALDSGIDWRISSERNQQLSKVRLSFYERQIVRNR